MFLHLAVLINRYPILMQNSLAASKSTINDDFYSARFGIKKMPVTYRKKINKKMN